MTPWADPTDCSPPSASVHGILQARILEWVATPSSKDLLTEGWNPGLLHCRQILYQLSYEGSPEILFYYIFDCKQKKKKQIIPSITKMTFFPNSFTSKQLLAIQCTPVSRFSLKSFLNFPYVTNKHEIEACSRASGRSCSRRGPPAASAACAQVETMPGHLFRASA